MTVTATFGWNGAGRLLTATGTALAGMVAEMRTVEARARAASLNKRIFFPLKTST